MNGLRRLLNLHSGEVGARQTHAHRLAVGEVGEADPLRARRFVPQIETAPRRGPGRPRARHPQPSPGQVEATTADPRVFVAVMTWITMPFLGDFELPGA